MLDSCWFQSGDLWVFKAVYQNCISLISILVISQGEQYSFKSIKTTLVQWALSRNTGHVQTRETRLFNGHLARDGNYGHQYFADGFCELITTFLS